MSRIPFIAAVVGALLVGGATTGSTYASWTTQAPLAPSSVASGQMAYTATTPVGVTLDKVAGASGDSTITIDDTSLGRNLTQRTTASVASTPAGISASVATTCGGATTFRDSTPTSPDQTFCVRVVVTDASTAVSGSVNVHLASSQRPTPGWTTPTITRTVPVTVNQPATPPAAPVLSCATARDGNNWNVTWTPIEGYSYTVLLRTEPSAAYQPLAPTGPGLYSVVMGTNNTAKRVKITATNPAGTSDFSNTLRVAQGTGASSLTCGAG